MKKVMVVYGTRPEAIKVAPVIGALKSDDRFAVLPVVTGQHREMLDQVNSIFGIKPVADLDLMRPGATLTELSVAALATLEPVLREHAPDAVVVQGDTSTAFIAALAAFYQGIPVIHLEAGLRTYDLDAPFPEEANRQLLSRVAALHLAPTQAARQNLVQEHITPASIAVTGNTVIDALVEAIEQEPTYSEPAVAAMVSSGRRFVLVTAHRRESWGQPMRNAMTAIRQVAERHPELHWVVPMHRNPVVRDVVRETLDDRGQVLLCEPLDYHEFCHVMKAAHLVLTDSGGVQEEGPSLASPVLVMRDTTERPEAVEAGAVRLVGTDTAVVSAALNELIEDAGVYASMARAVNPYGDGVAASRSVAAIAEFFGLGDREPDFDPHHYGD
ncbi:non-hydrolyzing UDP-N-acetylglucosamine 2-epimerase [uncultured Nocardioides sp.]|uniref:non-hydrolyzing UDP-N-acetylglucosamine 2-epimerase n=1 Tax=uncultured Nocardioides sp. TaxID=198441 RepID=UPI0026159F0A|nr:UDP-N-acetylglucosamine 2-epimerase (non-hydrolyzing) [uncultured Nocardioides sp.]